MAKKKKSTKNTPTAEPEPEPTAEPEPEPVAEPEPEPVAEPVKLVKPNRFKSLAEAKMYGMENEFHTVRGRIRHKTLGYIIH